MMRAMPRRSRGSPAPYSAIAHQGHYLKLLLDADTRECDLHTGGAECHQHCDRSGALVGPICPEAGWLGRAWDPVADGFCHELHRCQSTDSCYNAVQKCRACTIDSCADELCQPCQLAAERNHAQLAHAHVSASMIDTSHTCTALSGLAAICAIYLCSLSCNPFTFMIG